MNFQERAERRHIEHLRAEQRHAERLHRMRHGAAKPFDWDAYYHGREREKIEKAKQQKLMRQIIDAGYKAMAMALHPDRGGTHEDMARLNTARRSLKERL